MMFGKLFAQTFTGSMYGAGSDVIAVWAYVIANTRFNHSVELNPKMVAAMIGMTVEEAREAIAYLCAPDSASRTPDHGGARLLHDGGCLYTVVNAGKYRGIRNEEERREYMRIKKQESRSRQAEGGIRREPGEDG